MKWMTCEHSLSLGAFSYAVSGYYFASIIGRYTSIGESVQVGRGSHPTRWASTSPFFYQNHEVVLNAPLKEAAAYLLDAPYIAPRETKIGNDVYIGHGAFLLQGVEIGDGAVIGAMAVVTKDVPPYAVVAGNPATVRRLRLPPSLVERYLQVQWWQYAFWDLESASISEPERFIDTVEEKVAKGLKPYTPMKIDLRQVAADINNSQ